MKIVILGANGKVGSQVTALLLQRGHTVTAGVHKRSDNVPSDATLATLDITSHASLTELITGADAVVCALSSWKVPSHDVLSTTMKALIPAMEIAGISRIVSISGDVARTPNDTPSLIIRLFHLWKFGTVDKVVTDSESHLRQLYESNLDWTVIRPAVMTSSTNAAYTLQDKHPIVPFIPRAAVAASIADLIESGEHAREAPFIARGTR